MRPRYLWSVPLVLIAMCAAAQTVPPAPAERPTYRIGHRWLLDDGAYELTRIEDGVYVYTASGDREIHVTKDLVIAKVVKAGVVEFELDPPPSVSWPLRPGGWNSWPTVVRNPKIPLTTAPPGQMSIQLMWKVEGYEDVELPYGRAKAIRIEYAWFSNSWNAFGGPRNWRDGGFRVWYAPDVQQIVRFQTTTGPLSVRFALASPPSPASSVSESGRVHSNAPRPAPSATHAATPTQTTTPTQSASMQTPAAETERTSPIVNPYADSWALVVGINKYRRVPGLTYAVADAEAVADALPPLGFPRSNIRVLRDEEATKAKIEEVLYRDFAKMGTDDRLFVFFAGHGETKRLRGGEEGYLLPVDADPAALPLTAISMDEIKRIGQRLNGKHYLFVLDACFSGFAAVRDVTPVSTTDEYLAAALKEPVVQVLTAGRRGERAIEDGGHGLFTRRLLDGLRGLADVEGSGIITAVQLAAWIEPRVVRDSRGKMTPQYGKLDGEGQFVFVRPGVEVRLPQGRSERRAGVTSDDGADMVIVPAGDFWMGSNDGNEGERPRRRVYLDAFKIDRFEVTNEQFRAFVDANGYDRQELWSEIGWTWRSGNKPPPALAGVAPWAFKTTERPKIPKYWNESRWSDERQPVVGVSWFEADAYCRFAGKRLPTEAEWEKAARGTDGRTYPWGNDWDKTRANTADGKVKQTAAIDSYPDGRSVFGVHDMAGNAAEWVADWYASEYRKGRNPRGPESGSKKVVRGGSWDDEPKHVAVFRRRGSSPDERDNTIGFRCAADVAK